MNKGRFIKFVSQSNVNTIFDIQLIYINTILSPSLKRRKGIFVFDSAENWGIPSKENLRKIWDVAGPVNLIRILRVLWKWQEIKKCDQTCVALYCMVFIGLKERKPCTSITKDIHIFFCFMALATVFNFSPDLSLKIITK